MDFQALVEAYGLWPATTLILSWLIYRIEETRIAEKNERIAKMETDMRKALDAKDLEREEWKRLALETKSGRTTR